MNRRYLLTPVLLLTAIAMAVGLTQSLDDREVMVLPKGDEKEGRIAFEVKNCHRCHTVSGEHFPEIDLPAIDNIPLAGVHNGQWTRDDYAHHTMDPEHIISPEHQKAMLIIGDKSGAEKSPMPSFIDKLTVRDLINISTWLESFTSK